MAYYVSSGQVVGGDIFRYTYVLSGGTANSATVDSGGGMSVESGGTASRFSWDRTAYFLLVKKLFFIGRSFHFPGKICSGKGKNQVGCFWAGRSPIHSFFNFFPLKIFFQIKIAKENRSSAK